MEVESIIACWNELAARRPVTNHMSARLVSRSSRFYLAMDDHGMRHALIEVGDTSEVVTDSRSRGLLVLGKALSIDDAPVKPYLDIACLDHTSWDVFDLVIADVLENLERGITPNTAVERTLAKWRRFWGSALSPIMGSERVQGLFGELWFLSVWLLASNLGSVSNWFGPEGAPHDFVWQEKAVEVKTTSSAEHLHKVNGLEQLALPSGRDLYLFSIRVREDEFSTNSLPSLVSMIGKQLEGRPEQVTRFEELLMSAGYFSAYASRYEDMRYRVIEERLYLVGEGFPRLTTASFAGGLPAGIERVEYTINLSVCPQRCLAAEPGELRRVWQA